MRKTMISLAAFLLCCTILFANDYNIALRTDNAPDYTSMQSYIWSATSRCTTDMDKVYRLFRWAAQGRRQTSQAQEHGHPIVDPILFFNSYGYTFCSNISGINCAVWENMGYGYKRWETSAHSLSQVYYGDAWHWVDNSLTTYFLNNSGEIASIAEVAADMNIALAQYGPEIGSCYDGWASCSDSPDVRTLRHYWDTYAPNAYEVAYCNDSDWGHEFNLNLRPFEHYTRYWSPQGTTEDYYRPNGDGVDPDETWNLYNIRGNGQWEFEPDLTTNDYRKAIYSETGIESVTDSALTPNLHPAAVDTPASIIFKVYGANIITSADIEAVLERADAGDVARISVSRNNGIQWTQVYDHTGTGPATAAVHLKTEVEAALEFLVKVELQSNGTATDAGLTSIKITTITQVNRRTLPLLTLGNNRVQLDLGDQYESILLWPELQNDAYKNDIVDENNMSCETTHPGWNAVLETGAHTADCHVTYKLDAPTDITGVTYGGRFLNRSGAGSVNSHVDLLHSLNGSSFTLDHSLTEIDMPYDDVEYAELSALPGGTRSVWLKYNFWENYGLPEAYARTGAYSILMRVRHAPIEPTFIPIEVTYNWTEHRTGGDVTRQHTYLVTHAGGEEWRINVDGVKDPTMNWVRINLQDQGPDGAGVTLGYSDATDVGPDKERALKKYTWGTNLAKDCTYTASVAAGTFNGDTGGIELTDGIVGPQIVGGYGEGVVPGLALWETDAEPEFTVDLGSLQSVAAFRIWSAANSYVDGMVHPDHIDIEVSADDVTYTPVGSIDHNQLWDTPGDYIPWEHDDSATEDAVPHKGRVVYGFRLIPAAPVTARYIRYKTFVPAGGVLSFWELEAFASVASEAWENMLALPSYDTDNDNLPDEWELDYFEDTTSNSATDNADADAWDNAAELAAGTNPLLEDTDGDGVLDDTDPDPLDPLVTGAAPPSSDSKSKGCGNGTMLPLFLSIIVMMLGYVRRR